MSTSHEASDKLAEGITQFLRAKVGSDVGIAGEFARLQGGFDTDTYSFSVDNAPPNLPKHLVLRHFRHAGEAPRVVRESAIQNAAASAGHAVTAVPVDSSNELLVGRPFLLMERLPGTNLGELLMTDQTYIQKFPSVMAKLQAGLHRLDTTKLRAHLDASGVDLESMKPTRMLQATTAIADATGLHDLIELSQWLTENFPVQPENPAIIHGDLHPLNILMHEGKVSGLIDWATSMFTHPEYDIAVSRTILSIGPPEDIGIPKDELTKMLLWGEAEYMKECHALQTLDDALIDYYSVFRITHAYAKVLGRKHGVDLPYVDNDGYAWDRPDMYDFIKKLVGETTGIEMVSK